MRYLALAADYDGTLATDGVVLPDTVAGLERFVSTGRKLILVTGRELDELLAIFPQVHLFERVVAENGALLYRPGTHEEKPLGPAPPPEFVEALQARGVGPISVGRVIVATWQPHETAVLEVIRDLGLELQVIFNKGAVMILPAGVNKASGLKAALDEIGLSPHNVVGVGDAENDHALLQFCEFSTAVANAVPKLKDQADFVTNADHGAGVVELIDELVTNDLAPWHDRLSRRRILVGRRDDGRDVYLSPYGHNVLIAGSSGSGKSTLETALLERLGEQGYQFCVIDPEGDYEALANAVTEGDGQHPATVSEVLQLLAKPETNAVVNLVGVPIQDRPSRFTELLPRLQELRAKTGHPHCIVVDETHHLLPGEWDPAALALSQELTGMHFLTVHPDHVSPRVLATVDIVIAIGKDPGGTLQMFAKAVQQPAPHAAFGDLEPGHAVMWRRRTDEPPFRVRTAPGHAERRRHRRKYAEGELSPDRSFYFRGPENKLNLRAQNLMLFLQIADGVDDETWRHHLEQGDYSRWFRSVVKDPELAAEAEAVEKAGLPPKESRARVRAAIERQYTIPSASPLTATVQKRQRPDGP
jgi:hydroxymethylpyrimidine pyrophosphatase-like HAD family hydrolase